MVKVRQFKMVNSLGQTFDLMRKDAFFSTPSGLGLEYERNFERAGTSFIQTEGYNSQRLIEGIMYFDGYATYTEFKNFVASQPLKLLYTPESTQYTIDCYISELTKSEIQRENRRLSCDIVLVCTSLWYINRTLLTMSGNVADPKQYNYDYDYNYAESKNGYIQSSNNSPNEASCIITIWGSITNPAWYLTVNNVRIQSGGVTGTIDNGHKLVINSRDNQLEIADYTSSGTYYANMYQASNFSAENFIRIPSGNFTLTVIGENVTTVTCTLEIIEEYETV